MMAVKIIMPSVVTAPALSAPPVRVTRTNVGNLGEPTFYNDTNRVIKVREMRFVAMPPSNISADAGVTTTYNFDLARRFGATIRHSNYDIARDYLPLYALSTRNNVASPLLDASMAFTLPAEYLCPAGSAFQMRVRSEFASLANLATQNFGIGLCGNDDKHNPYILARTVQPAVNQTGVVLAFNENAGGGQAKNLHLRDINFNVSDVFDYPGNNFLWGLQNEVQFVPPEGPRWHSPLDWFPVNGIANQGNSYTPTVASCATAIYQQNWVSYKPITPHIVTPRQQIDIDLKCYQTANYVNAQGATISQTPIWVIMLGTQESLA
jgi:hypothetical protein